MDVVQIGFRKRTGGSARTDVVGAMIKTIGEQHRSEAKPTVCGVAWKWEARVEV